MSVGSYLITFNTNRSVTFRTVPYSANRNRHVFETVIENNYLLGLHNYYNG